MKLDGKPLDIRKLAASKESLIRMLDESPADELFSRIELERLGYTRSQLEHWTVSLGNTHSAKISGIRYWGNPKAIKELDKQLKAVR